MTLRSTAPRCGVAAFVLASACAAPAADDPAPEGPASAQASAFKYFDTDASSPVAKLVSPRAGGQPLRICLAGDAYPGEDGEARAKAEGKDTSGWKTRDAWQRVVTAQLRPWIDAAQGASFAPLVSNAEIGFDCTGAAFEVGVVWRSRPCS
jgi:hypothetical protein